jgi:hypothetical protein
MMPRLLGVVGWCAAFAVVANPVADRVGLKYWQPCVSEDMVNVYAFQAREVAAEVLFVGSSRTFAAVIPGQVERELAAAGLDCRAYNLGQPATGMVAATIVLRDALLGYPAPRVVVLEVTPRAVDAGDRFLDRNLRNYASLEDTARALSCLQHPRAALAGTLRGFVNFAFAAYRPPSSGACQAKIEQALYRRGALWPDDVGPDPCDSVADWTEERRRETLIAVQELKRPPFRVGRLTRAALEEAASLARQQRFNLILVRYPEHDAYRRLVAGEPERHFGSFVRDLVARRGLRFVDLTETPPLPETLFMDFSHLNRCGAREVTTLLAREVRRAWSTVGAPDLGADGTSRSGLL